MKFDVTMSHEDLITELKAGNARYKSDDCVHPDHEQSRRNELLDGQAPPAIVLSCADSRVAPELLFDRGLGQLFIVRVAGNVANKSSVASMEYAVAHCQSKLIVVLGHEACGAVNARKANGNNDLGSNLNHLLAHITPAISACGADADTETLVKKNVELTIKEMMNSSDIISDAVNKGTVKFVPAYYNLAGEVEFLEDVVLA